MPHKVQNKNSGILTFLLSILFFSFLIFKPAFSASDAGLLPNAIQQYFDSNGNPLSSGKVYFYEVGTSTFKDVYNSSAATTPYTNPVPLNAGGKPPGSSGIYGIGLYRQLVKDRNGNTIWDAVTSPSGSGGSTPTNVGDGNLVGTVLSWSGLVAPNQYAFAYGQEIARSNYPEFYTAVTLQANVICSASSNILTGIADTSQIPIGAAVELSLCVSPGSTVVSKTVSTVTLSNPSTVSINAVGTFFPYGNGDGVTTFNVPDLRGRAIAGRDNMGGSAAGRLTATYFNTAGLGAVGGLQSVTLSQSNLPNVTLTTTISAGQGSHAHSLTPPLAPASGTGSTSITGASTGGPPQISTALATLPAMTGTTPLSGSSVPFSLVQPTITLNYIIKVTPDTSTSIATGVYSIGGMSGVISCGTGILCTGNIISFNGNVIAGGSTGSIQFRNSDGSFGGSANALFISPNNLTLGAPGTSFLFDIFGSTSGRVRQTVPAIAGATDIAWGNTSGTPAVTASLPIVLNTTTGNLTCPTCATATLNGAALTRTNDTNVTVTLGGTPTTALLNAASLTLGWSGTLAAGRLNSNVVQSITNDTNVTGSISAQNLTLGWSGTLAAARGGFGADVSASSGVPLFAAGVPTFTGTNGSGTFVRTTSAALITPNIGVAAGTSLNVTSSVTSAGVLVKTTGGGDNIVFQNAGGTNLFYEYLSGNNLILDPANRSTASFSLLGTLASTSTTTGALTVAGGIGANAASSLAGLTITGTLTANNLVTNAALVQAAAATIKGNPTASTANVQDFTFGSLTQTVSPGSLDWIPIFDNSTGTIKKVNAASIASSSVAGVASIAGNTGAFTLSTGLTNSVNDLRVDIATASQFESGTASKMLDASVVFTSETTTTYGTTTAFDFNTFINSKVTLTGNITTMNCSNMKQGQAGTIAFIQDGVGSRTAAFNTGTCSTTLKFAGATFPTLTTSASAIDILSYSCRSGSYCAAALSKGYNP